MKLRRIGYWLGERSPGLPDPRQFVDEGWDQDDREFMAAYLRRGLLARAYLGCSECRICGARVGSVELSDGTFIWPESLAHYVLVHGVRLPVDFLQHVRGVVEQLEDAEVDESWWRSFGEPPVQ